MVRQTATLDIDANTTEEAEADAYKYVAMGAVDWFDDEVGDEMPDYVEAVEGSGDNG
jgi:hypothetical protein